MKAFLIGLAIGFGISLVSHIMVKIETKEENEIYDEFKILWKRIGVLDERIRRLESKGKDTEQQDDGK